MKYIFNNLFKTCLHRQKLIVRFDNFRQPCALWLVPLPWAATLKLKLHKPKLPIIHTTEVRQKAQFKSVYLKNPQGKPKKFKLPNIQSSTTVRYFYIEKRDREN